MKTRYLTLTAFASLALAACSSAPSSTTSVEARLRNDLPATCTAEQQKACPAVNVASCPDGQEPVLDYSKDCCAHFTCQPVCQSAQAKTCPMTPAPVCPTHSKLWIGTAVEDCCPAYRCESDGTGCDPTTGNCACDATSVACTLALPYCGPNVQPMVVGQSSDCCPIYQCPCFDATGATLAPADTKFCGCTFPNCKAGEEVICAGADSCSGPCSCQPAKGSCTTDAECPSDARCDVSNCLLPPTPVPASSGAACDPSACGPALGQPNKICPDGVTEAGPTGRCLTNANGGCGWEIAQCPPVVGSCYGNCVPNVQSGCKADSDCPSGQACSITCSGWGCGSAGTTTGGTGAGSTPPSTGGAPGSTGGSSTGSACACPASDPSCTCDANGNCSGQTCTGQCAPAPSKCDPSKPVACPAIAIACPNGATPVQGGIDPTTCCPTFQCPTCAKATTTANVACPAIAICACAKQTGTDPTTCCPTYDCGPVKADGSCG